MPMRLGLAPKTLRAKSISKSFLFPNKYYYRRLHVAGVNLKAENPL